MKGKWEMKSAESEALRKVHVTLAKQLVSTEIVHHLLSAEILTEEMVDLLETCRGTFQKNTELLRLLPKRGPRAFEEFCRALDRTKQSHLTGLLRESVTEEEALCKPTQESECVTPAKKFCSLWRVCLDAGDGSGTFSVRPTTAQFYHEHHKQSYRMASRPRGAALIVSNEVFVGEGLGHRPGGAADTGVLRALLSQLGYRVTSVCNSPAQELETRLRDFALSADHRRTDSCVVVLLSHGVEGAIYGVDGKLVQIHDIFQLFDNANCPNLQNKPKMFFIQACRGDRTDRGVDRLDGADAPGCEECDAGKERERTRRGKLPTQSDIICGYACLRGTAALRNTRQGSWYIQALVKVFTERAHNTHVADMLVQVNAVIRDREGFAPGTDFHRCKEMAEYSIFEEMEGETQRKQRRRKTAAP
uniref:Caspase-2 n=1 Tax=Callorhinchus milii TaxID=7868 RepID=V9KZT1_CALMI